MKAPIILSLFLACGPLWAAEKEAEKSPAAELIEAMRFETVSVDSALATFDGTVTQMKASGVPAEAIAEIREEARLMYVKIFSGAELKKKAADTYSKHFTPEEIVELTKFYRTPLGQKTLAAMPVTNAETTKAAMEAFQAEVPAYQKKVSEIVAKHQKPAEKPDKEADGE